MRVLTPFLLLQGLISGISLPGEASAAKPIASNKFVHSDSLRWPLGTELVPFENLEGMVLLRGTLRGRVEADTSGPLALDTGAGYLALDLGLARILGLADSGATAEAVDLAARPLPRLTLGGWTIDQIEPVLTVDGAIVRRVSDRPVLGLLGQKVLRDRAIWIDYREERVALIPAGPPPPFAERTEGGTVPDSARSAASRDSALARSRALLAAVLTPRAVAVPFVLVGDGKILVRGAVSDPRPPRYSGRLNFLIDTGATKCVLFEDRLAPGVRRADAWPTLRGLSAPTLIGAAKARLARIPSLEIEAAGGRFHARDVDTGVIRSELSEVLSRVTRETIHGLIGYSLLKRFRIALDYPNRILWLDPIPNYRDDRPLEYCHVGLQLERQDGAVVVTGVAERSPAERAGITHGDEVVALDGAPVAGLDLIALTRRMEGMPGRPLTLVIRRGAVDRTYRLVRRRLL